MLGTHPERRHQRVERDDNCGDRRSKYQNRGEDEGVGNGNAGQQALKITVNDPVRRVSPANTSQSLQTSRV